MKTKKLDKKLALSKETLKNLDAREAEKVAGGTIDPGYTVGRCWTQVFSLCLC